jgi:hypothetical protein
MCMLVSIRGNSQLLITVFSGLYAFNYMQGKGYKVTRFLMQKKNKLNIY